MPYIYNKTWYMRILESPPMKLVYEKLYVEEEDTSLGHETLYTHVDNNEFDWAKACGLVGENIENRSINE